MDHGEERSTTVGDSAGVPLLATSDYGEALLVRELLASYGIPCRLVSDVSPTLLPITVWASGRIWLSVPRAGHAEAIRLLAEHRRQGLRVLRGGKRERPRATAGERPRA